ncbi:MAG: hypothetical protein KKB50_21400, partial [Planctomycetes bacterium]|nr:hypothetical protein [Planctomycetota bacterium]
AAAWLIVRYVHSGQTTGLAYYATDADGRSISLTMAEAEEALAAIETDPAFAATDQAAAREGIRFSWPRTAGIWLAALLTLAVFSFLYRDNVLYKVAEHAFVGISAAYWMTVAFWRVFVPNLAGKLFPGAVKTTCLPRLNLDEIALELGRTSDGDGLTAPWWQLMDFWYWIPVLLGVLLLWRMAPRGAWIARWPLAFIVGITAGLRLLAFLEADFVAQVQATIVPLLVVVHSPANGQVDFGVSFYSSLNNTLLVLGVVCGLVYFFFSVEHKGVVGMAARGGIYVLMITFGAGFGYAVMGRIALLVGRIEFLCQDWLNLSPG